MNNKTIDLKADSIYLSSFLFMYLRHVYSLIDEHGWEEQLYPIAAVIGTALGLCGFCMGRNLSINPDVRWEELENCRCCLPPSSN